MQSEQEDEKNPEEAQSKQADGKDSEAVQPDGKKLESVPRGETVADSSKYIVTLEKCVQKALAQGVNCIMLAEEASDETVSRMEMFLETDAEVLEGYYLFFIQ